MIMTKMRMTNNHAVNKSWYTAAYDDDDDDDDNDHA